MIVFTALPFSPWSEKAQFALDHHQIAYAYDPFVPLLGEVKLRLRLRKPTGRVTVPVLQDGSTWITDSFDIARHADRIGAASRLFPADKLAEISDWNQRSETALAAGRARMMLAMTSDPALAMAFLPPSVPSALRTLLRPIARKGVEAFITKYRMRENADLHESTFQRELDRLADTLAGRQYLIGDTLSYADITMALLLQGISPVDERYMAKLPVVRPNADLQRRYASLITWRDKLYAQHRRPRKLPA